MASSRLKSLLSTPQRQLKTIEACPLKIAQGIVEG
jgi:hypothetical protein